MNFRCDWHYRRYKGGVCQISFNVCVDVTLVKIKDNTLYTLSHIGVRNTFELSAFRMLLKFRNVIHCKWPHQWIHKETIACTHIELAFTWYNIYTTAIIAVIYTYIYILLSRRAILPICRSLICLLKLYVKSSLTHHHVTCHGHGYSSPCLVKSILFHFERVTETTARNYCFWQGNSTPPTNKVSSHFPVSSI